jgi:hypothetical protein
MQVSSSSIDLVAHVDATHRVISSEQRHLFRLIVECDRQQVWRDAGVRDLAHWLVVRYGISEWKARRWIACAYALESLPRVARAFASGELGIDKVVELTRLATPETEERLIEWAGRVSTGAIRQRADVAARQHLEEAAESERCRSLSWWFYDEGKRFGLEAYLPAADGAIVARALDRLAETLPRMPGEDDELFSVAARRADALVAACSARLADEQDADRASVVVHAQAAGLLEGNGGSEIEGGPVIHPQTARRLLCFGRMQLVVEDIHRQPVEVGRASRVVPAWMLRQLRYRDYECTFPGCGARRFTQAHHIVWWDRGGRTDLDNLALVCFFHHKLVHEFGWSLQRCEGSVRWFWPDGTRYRAGPAPPGESEDAAREPVEMATSVG